MNLSLWEIEGYKFLLTKKRPLNCCATTKVSWEEMALTQRAQCQHFGNRNKWTENNGFCEPLSLTEETHSLSVRIICCLTIVPSSERRLTLWEWVQI